jgi:hypothetical protein
MSWVYSALTSTAASHRDAIRVPHLRRIGDGEDVCVDLHDKSYSALNRLCGIWVRAASCPPVVLGHKVR